MRQTAPHSRQKRSESTTSSIKIRAATKSDLKIINDIYNHYVLNSTCTYQEGPEPLKGRQKWFAHHGRKHPITVAVENNKVVGWGSLSAYHARSAYSRTVESSVYVHYEHHRRGIGSLLLEDLVVRARQAGHRVIIAAIDADQPASIALHSKFDFKKVGHFKQVGFKFDRWLDVVYMELLLT
jgi:L-amino acid N-acyltransferase